MCQAQMKPAKRVKIRQCVGCRNEDEVGSLLRFVACDPSCPEEFALSFDPLSKLPGRGAYLHLQETCIHNALKFGFARAFRSKLPPTDKREFINRIQQGLRRRLTTILRGGFKSRDAVVGETEVAAAMKDNRLDLLIIASDAGAATEKKYRLNSGRKGIRCENTLFDRQQLGSIIGRDSLSLIGFRGELATTLMLELDLYLTAVSF